MSEPRRWVGNLACILFLVGCNGNPPAAESLPNRGISEELGVQPVLPSKSVFSYGDLVVAQGAWVWDGMDRQSVAVMINCIRAMNQCIEAQAVFQPIGNDHILNAYLQRWEIASWDHVEITTVPADYPCIREFMRINVVQQSASKIQSKISDSDQCRSILDGDGMVTMVSGADVAATQRAGK